MQSLAFIDISIGTKRKHEENEGEYQNTINYYNKQCTIYGWKELEKNNNLKLILKDEEQQEIFAQAYEQQWTSFTSLFKKKKNGLKKKCLPFDFCISIIISLSKQFPFRAPANLLLLLFGE